MKSVILFLFVFIANSVLAQQSAVVKNLLKQLSLEEKAKIVVGMGMDFSSVMTGVGVTEEKVPGAAGTSIEISRLKIPAIVFADGPAGVRISPTRKNMPGKTYFATAFPVATLLASTFNPEIVQTVGEAFGDETKEYGVDILLAPALNIHRNPLGGRNFEYYSEDPILSGKVAAAFTRGVQSHGVGVSIKHFAANNQETNRNTINTIVSERALREIYLKGFEIAVKESNPWTVMSSYNKINDVYTAQHHDLLTTILRDEWGFKGFVMTDWFGGDNPVEAMKAGNDLLMPGYKQQQDDIIEAVTKGKLTMADLDKNVARILEIYIKTPSYLKYKISNQPKLDKHKTIAREAASEGFVLLKNNDHTLPFEANKANLAVFGNASYLTIAGGTGSGDVNKAYTISIVEGMEKAGFMINKEIQKTYNTYLKDKLAKIKPKEMFFMPGEVIEELDFTNEQLTEIASKNSAGVFTISRTSGEFFDRKLEGDFLLKANELDFLKRLSAAFHQQHKSVVVVLNIGGVIETASWKNLADAILLIWQPGQEGGHAVADVLSGRVNPSGKLTMTFPIQYSDVYTSKNFPGKEIDSIKSNNPMVGNASEVIYEEDIYVGYRYFETYKVATSFPFGFGMSYTNFNFSDLKTKLEKDGSVNLSFVVTNTGELAGKEVAQIYLSAPKGELNKPAKELKAFVKTNLLGPNKSQKIELTLSAYELSSFDTNKSAWICEAGVYTFAVGASINQLSISSFVNKTTNETTLKTNKCLAPTRNIQILKGN